MTRPNAELAYRVLDHIDADPDSWMQETWACGSSHCFGGWAILLGAEAAVSYNTPSGVAGVIAGPEHLVGRDAEDAANEILGLKTAFVGDADETEWLYDPEHTREDLGRLVEEIFGPRPDVGEIIDHGPVKPPYGTPEREGYDRENGAAS